MISSVFYIKYACWTPDIIHKEHLLCAGSSKGIIPTMCQVLYIKYSCYESGALHKVHLLCARSSVSKIIHHPSLSALGQHPGIRQRPKWWQVGRYLWTEEQTEAQRGQASSLSCRTGRNLCLSYHQACLSPLPCCSTLIHKGQCPVNPGILIKMYSQAKCWPQGGDTLRSLYHHMDHTAIFRVHHSKDLQWMHHLFLALWGGLWWEKAWRMGLLAELLIRKVVWGGRSPDTGRMLGRP